MTYCWKCAKAFTDLPPKISFRELCPYCGVYLHCCKNCQFYQPGLSNDCRIPGTDPIRDRESINYCEEFKLKGAPPPPKANPDDITKRLFRTFE